MKAAIITLVILVLVGVGLTVLRTATMSESPPKPTTEGLLASLLPLSIKTQRGVVNLFVEVADEPAEKSRGLQNRAQLATRSGMLFIFEEESVKHFWMKDTLLPLDILWIDQSKTIVGHDTMTPCKPENDEDPCPVTSSPPDTLYVLEVHDQFVEENAIGVGDRLIFTLP